MNWDRKRASPKMNRGHETMTKIVWKKGKIKIWQRPVFLKNTAEKTTTLQICRIKKITLRTGQTSWDRQLCFYVKKLFVSEKTQKSELCHFSKQIFVIKFFPVRVCSSSKSGKFDDVNVLRKMTKFTFLCIFTNKYFFHIKAKLTVSKSF